MPGWHPLSSSLSLSALVVKWRGSEGTDAEMPSSTVAEYSGDVAK